MPDDQQQANATVRTAAIVLRRAGPDDAESVRRLTRTAYAKWVPLIGREPLPMRTDYDAAVRNHCVDLLTVNGELAALIETVPGADHLLIENVAVLPAFQGRGLGRKLMSHAETLASGAGLPEMRLFTNKDFTTNVQFYRRLGYQVDREEPFMGGLTVHMSKRLAPAGGNTTKRGTAELATLLASIEPKLTDVEMVFCSFPRGSVQDKRFLSPLGSFEEQEGTTLIVRRADAEQHGVPFQTILKQITLTAHSSLEAVGLTAAVATTLAAHGISANVVAAFHHDHVFVPAQDAERALAALRDLQAEAALGRSVVAATSPEGEDDRAGWLASEAELAVQGQLDAYNARDIDAFMKWWAEDCQYYEFPGRLLARGAVEVRERHIARFNEPNLHGRLLKRVAVSDVVVDQEIVTRTFPDGPGEVDVVAIYEVKAGQISNACFKIGVPRLFSSRTPA